MMKVSHPSPQGRFQRVHGVQNMWQRLFVSQRTRKQKAGRQPGAELEQSPPPVTHLPAMPSPEGPLQHLQTALPPGDHMCNVTIHSSQVVESASVPISRGMKMRYLGMLVSHKE